jgi:hypothetical protein
VKNKQKEERLEALKQALKPNSYSLKIKDEKLKELLSGLEAAQGYQLAYKGFHNPGTFEAVNEEIPRLHKALMKLASKKGTQKAAIKSITKAVRSIKRDCPGALAELDAISDLQLTMPVDIERSAFERHIEIVRNNPSDTVRADQLASITAAFMESLKKPGRGGARKQAREYMEGLLELARQFSEALPNHKLSEDQNSLFYRYALYWMTDYMDEEITDPERHIRAALAEYRQNEKISV